MRAPHNDPAPRGTSPTGPAGPPGPLRRGFSARGTPVVVAVVVAAVLTGNALLLLKRIHDASEEVARGQGAAFGFAAANAVRLKQALLTPAELQVLVDEHQEAGLRFLGEYGPDGHVIAQIGTPRGSSVVAGGPSPPVLEHNGDRFRVSHPLPITPGQPRHERAIVAYEFEPETSAHLDTQGRLILVASLLSAAAVLALAVLLVRATDARAQLVADVEKNRHLASLGEMAGVLAHQVKNPLQSLKGHAQLLVEQLPTDTPAAKKAADKAGVVVAEAVRLEQLVEELLRFLQAGTGALSQAPVDLSQLFDELQLAQRARVTITRAADGRPPVVTLDPVLFRQALKNVVDNALKQEHSAQPEVHLVDSGDAVVITVRDHGSGIPDADLPHVFEPFFTRSAQGTGLGLTIARRVVELHGGTLTAANAHANAHADGNANADRNANGHDNDTNASVVTSNGGAVFTFRLPRTSPRS